MPEQYLHQFTEATEILPGDLFPIQRQVDGTWTDFAMPRDVLFGVLMLVKTQTFNLNDLLSAPQQIVGSSGPGKFWVPLDIKALYTPGNASDDDGCLITVNNFYWNNLGRFVVSADQQAIAFGEDISSDYYITSDFSLITVAATKDNAFVTPGGTIRITVRYISADT